MGRRDLWNILRITIVLVGLSLTVLTIPQKHLYLALIHQLYILLGKVFKLLHTTKITTGFGLGSLCSSLLRHDVVAVADVFIYLINISSSLSSIADCWRPVIMIPIAKPTNSTALTKSFRPITLKSFDLKLTERVVLGP